MCAETTPQGSNERALRAARGHAPAVNLTFRESRLAGLSARTRMPWARVGRALSMLDYAAAVRRSVANDASTICLDGQSVAAAVVHADCELRIGAHRRCRDEELEHD